MKPSITLSSVALLTFALNTLIPAIDVTKSQYDLGCTNANTSETVLTTSNVNSSSFGKLFSKSVDGNVYAQPLYLQSYSIAGGTHNVVFVCTENNSIYAFDADNGSAATLWQRSLGTPQTISSCSNISPVYGITATPVIDRNAGALYVVACTKEGSANYQRLYAINLQDGTDLLPPVIIRDTVPGTGWASSDGKVGFDGLLHFCRTGLLLLNGKIYIGAGSHCDAGNYHGWLFACNASNLGLSAGLCITPNDTQGSVWQSGGGLSSDGTSIFCTTGNGSFNPSTNAWGISILKLDSSLNILSSFTPYNYNILNDTDWDISSSVLLIPGSSLCTAMGKGGNLYVMNRNNLGGNHPSGDSVVQSITTAAPVDPSGGNPNGAFWHNLYFTWAGNDSVKARSFDGTKLSATLQSFYSAVRQGASAGGITISANGDTNGILWGSTYTGSHLYAFDASHVATMLWNDGQAASNRDKLAGSVVKFARSIVTNGKVYIGTSNSLVVYGLLGSTGTIGVPTFPAGNGLVNNVKLGRHSVSLAFGSRGSYEILVSDLSGRTVARLRGETPGGSERISLPGAGLVPGAYIAFIRVGEQQVTAETFVGRD